MESPFVKGRLSAIKSPIRIRIHFGDHYNPFEISKMEDFGAARVNLNLFPNT